MRRIRVERRRWLIAAILLAALIGGAPLPAAAGANCTEKRLTPEAVANAARLGNRVFQALKRSAAQVALIGRAGADLSAYGLRFSHIGFALRTTPQNGWTVLHLLNRCGTATSTLYNEGLINFFLDDPFAYEAVIAIPAPEIQPALQAVLAGPLVWRLHQPHYNTIAHPRSLAFQNSNQWALELLIAALAKGSVHSRAEAQHHPLFQQYQADVVQIDRLTRIGGGLFQANLTFSDHPLSSRVKGQYAVVTVRSVLRFLERMGNLQQLQIVDLQRDTSSRWGAAAERL